MFSITTKTIYGLLAIIDLAEHYGKDLVQIKDIVNRRKVPKNYLEQIMNRLTKQGIVKSVRGNKGGYELGPAPGALTLLQVIEALEGGLKLKETAEGSALKELFGDLEETIKQALSIPIAHLVERQQAWDQQISYQI
jgi:Rrf2 family transcriptional regulator, cysteine metabolism repressor